MKTRTAACILAFGLAMSVGPAIGQERSAVPAFEVASIKPAAPLSPDLIRKGQFRLGVNIAGTRADFGFMSLADLLPYAYRVKPFQIAGPDWMRDSRWDILARLPEGESTDRVPEMMQTLLAERFKLAVHRENREHQVYELVAGNNGLKIQPAEPEENVPAANSPAENRNVPGFFVGGGLGAGPSNIQVNTDGRGMVVAGGPNGTMRISQSPSGGMRLEMSRVTMPALADMLTPFTDRVVIDRTELKGAYRVALNLPMEAMMAMVQRAAQNLGVPGVAGARGTGPGGFPGTGQPGQVPGASDPSGSSIFEAVQELGLKLQARKAPVETIVVDRAEKTPTEN